MKRPIVNDYREEVSSRRNLCTAYAIREAYSNLESLIEELSFPKSEFFSAERFISELEKRSWKYDGISRDARKPIHGLTPAMESYEEKISELLEYKGDKESDIMKTVQNAEKRIRYIHSTTNGSEMIMFSSPVHGRVLSQELYEAGWNWFFHLGSVKFGDDREA